MKKNRIKFLIIELFLLMLAVFFVWKIFDQNVAEDQDCRNPSGVRR